MKSFRLTLAFAAALLAAPAFAQEEAPPPQQKAPQATDTKEIGDWTVQCYAVKSPMPCQMLELRVAKKTGQRILGVLLAYAPENGNHLIKISVPLGVSLQNGLIINLDSWKSPPVKFHACDQGGCYIESAIGNDIVGQLSKAADAKVRITSVDGKPYDLPFSLKGFTEAHNTLVELAKAKVGKGGAAAPAAN